jgi:hypothetical protein
MGREAVTRAEWRGEVAEVKALLEGREIILRGDIKAHLPLADTCVPRVDGDDLVLWHGGDKLVLSLGAVEAAKWLKALTTPPKSLAEKLGVKDALVRVSGPWDSDPELANALTGRIGEPARVAVAVVLTLDAFDHAVAVALRDRLPTWFVHAKGKALVTDALIRTRLRDEGWIDTKTAAVSDRLTTTRYQPRT